MRMLLPTPAPAVDIPSVYASPPRGPVAARPWVLLNMISSVDGAATDLTGRSGGLGNAEDRAVLVALRAVADVIVAGAGTVRTENYGPARIPAELRTARIDRGQASTPRIAVVSASLRLDPDMRLFREPSEERPLVMTVEGADPEARRRLEPLADVVVAGEHQLDWGLALSELRRVTGAAVAVVEGGPTVNGQLLAEDLVDEMCMTLAPALLGGTAPRAAHGAPPEAARRLRLAHVLEADGYLMLRYLVER